MIDWDTWQEIFNSIRRHKLRTFLTAIGVSWGIFMLIFLLGAGSGLQNGVEHNFKDDATNSIWMYRGSTSMPYKGLPVGRDIKFDNADYDLIKDGIEGSEYVTGRYYVSNGLVRYKDKKQTYDIRSVHPDHLHLENTLVTKGRYINDKDLKDFRKVVCIGDLIEEDIFGEEDALGKYVDLNGVVYQVIGVFTDTGGDRERRKIYLPISTAQKIYEGTDRVHQIMFTTGDATIAGTQQMEKDIREAMGQKHNFDPEDSKAIYLSNNLEEFKQFQSLFGAIKIFFWIVGIGSIFAGIISVSNIMLIVVKDRTKEIGVRKALGATPRSIVGMIMKEAILITSVAGYLGLLAGVSLIFAVNWLLVKSNAESEFFRNPEIDLSVAVAATILLIISGALAGLIPAMQAVKINPVQAMKA